MILTVKLKNKESALKTTRKIAAKQYYLKLWFKDDLVKGNKLRFYVEDYILVQLAAKETAGEFGYATEAYFDFSEGKSEFVLKTNKQDGSSKTALALANKLFDLVKSNN